MPSLSKSMTPPKKPSSPIISLTSLRIKMEDGGSFTFKNKYESLEDINSFIEVKLC